MSLSKPVLPAAEPIYNPSRPFPNIEPIYITPISNCPGKTMVSVQISFPPNGSTPPHTHAGAFVVANVVSGYVLNKMNDEPMAIIGPGEYFTEHPGCKHNISDNASPSEPAVMIATLVIDTKVIEELGPEGLVVIDPEYQELIKRAGLKTSADARGYI